jgi:cytosine/creatinine deaminase
MTVRTLIRGIRQLGDPENTVDLLIAGGVIERIGTSLGPGADLVIDGDGGLALPAFVNTHVHLDKCLTGEEAPPGASPTLDDSVRRTWQVKRSYTVEGILERAGTAVRSALAHGTTTIRAFADVDPIGGLVPVEGLCALRDRWRDRVTIEVVAFPQEGIVRAPGTEDLMAEALRIGADVVGGLPWFEFSDDDARRHVDICLDLAESAGKDVHMLVDDTDDPHSRSLEYLALQTDRRGLHGRVAASHCGALSAYDDAHAARVIDLVARAAMTVVSNSHISLVFGGRLDRGRIRRGTTRVRELRDAGVNLAAAQDDVHDPYYPFGRNDQLEVAQYMCHVAQLISQADIAYAIEMVTSNGARAMRMTDYGLREGCRGDVVVYRASHATEALRLMEPPRYVVRNGRLVAENEIRQTVTGPGWGVPA